MQRACGDGPAELPALEDPGAEGEPDPKAKQNKRGPKPEPEPKPEPKPESDNEPEPDDDLEPDTEPEPDAESESKPEPEPESQPDPESERPAEAELQTRVPSSAPLTVHHPAEQGDVSTQERRPRAVARTRTKTKGKKASGLRVPDESRGRRPLTVTVDSSKARTSLDALKISLKQLKWREFPFGRRLPCDIYWHGVSFHDSDILSGQVNKFPGMTEMVRKITLSRAVRIMQDLFPEEYNFYPRSWILPDEFQLFVAQVRMVKDGDPSWKPTFIVKPDSGCQGDGIYLIKDPSDIRMAGHLQSRPAVVQEYICKPLLIDKLKFDIRLYVLLKSLEPLEIYIAKDGLSRFCTEPYQEPNFGNLHHVFMHLTNYSLNIHSENFIHSDNANTGSKRTFSSILCRLSSKGVDIKKIWSDIISLVIKTVIALTPELKVFYQSDIPAGRPGPTCFQILGFDILLMKNLKPMLLEVNANPSMRIEHEQELSPGVFENVPSLVDEEVKVAVIRDTLRLIDPLKNKKKENRFPDVFMDRKSRFPSIFGRMSPSKLQFSKFSIVRYSLVEQLPLYLVVLSCSWNSSSSFINGYSPQAPYYLSQNDGAYIGMDIVHG